MKFLRILKDSKYFQRILIIFDCFKAVEMRYQLLVQTWTNASNKGLIQGGGRMMDRIQLDCWVGLVVPVKKQDNLLVVLDERNLCHKDGNVRLKVD